jgi:hypothetical protein
MCGIGARHAPFDIVRILSTGSKKHYLRLPVIEPLRQMGTVFE